LVRCCGPGDEVRGCPGPSWESLHRLGQRKAGADVMCAFGNQWRRGSASRWCHGAEVALNCSDSPLPKTWLWGLPAPAGGKCPCWGAASGIALALGSPWEAAPRRGVAGTEPVRRMAAPGENHFLALPGATRAQRSRGGSCRSRQGCARGQGRTVPCPSPGSAGTRAMLRRGHPAVPGVAQPVCSCVLIWCEPGWGCATQLGPACT